MQNNNASMQTVVETFFVEETIDLVHDNEKLTKWNEKVKELELAGQEKIVVEDKSPIPFLWMNSALTNTFEILCPTKVDVKKFDKSPIPVELLEIVSLSVKEEYFYKIEVWYNEKVKDPVIVGYKKTKGSTDWEKQYYAEKYLIGRWADVKASLDALVERAKRIFFQNETLRLKQAVRDSQRGLEDLETKTEQMFGGAMPETIIPF